MADEKPDRDRSVAEVWARYGHIGYTIPAAVLIGLFLGKLLDRWLHTHWLFLVGLIIGAVAGFTDVIRTVVRQDK